MIEDADRNDGVDHDTRDVLAPSDVSLCLRSERANRSVRPARAIAAVEGWREEKLEAISQSISGV